MDSGGQLNQDDEAKSKLVPILTKHVSQFEIPASEYPSPGIVAIDAVKVVQKISNPASVKTFKDLADVFFRGIMSRSRHWVWHVLRCFSKELHTIWASWEWSPSRIRCRWCLWYYRCKFKRNFISYKNKAAVDFSRYRLCYCWKWIDDHVMGWTISQQPRGGSFTYCSHALEQVLCIDMLLYTLTSNLFFKIENWFSLIGQICFLTIKTF